MASNDETLIRIKANKDGFVLVPHPSAPFESILKELQDRLAKTRDFFARSEMVLDLRRRSLKTSQIAALHKLLKEKGQVKVVEVQLADDLRMALDQPSAPAQPPPPPPPRKESREDREGVPVIIRSTCRSGIRIESSSDCVILGDVNPGAEVLAVGDIIVFGNLRGIAHAGALGDRSARIWAFSIEPSQIRIADLVAIPPKGDKSTSKRYEIAEVQGDLIELITL
jgi:septum site-determining protein MinC